MSTTPAVVLTATLDRSPRTLAPIAGPLVAPHVTHRLHGLWVSIGLFVIAAMHVINVAGWPSFQDDEGTYFSQAWAVQRGTLAPYVYWYDHPPFGWIQLAVTSWIPQTFAPSLPSLTAGRLVMVAYTLVSAALLYRLARNVGLKPAFAIGAMMLWGLSPLVVLEGRQILLDNLAMPWLIGAFVLATARQRYLWHYVAAGLCFGLAVLSKETMIIAAPALVMAVWTFAYKPTRSFAVMGFTVMTMITGSVYLIFAVLRNELLSGPGHVSIQDALAFQFFKREGSGFILSEGTGSHGLLKTWLQLDSVLLVFGLLAALACLRVRRLWPIGVVVLSFVLVALRPGGYMPGMYVIALLPFLALALAAVGDFAWRVSVRRIATRVLVATTISALLVGVAATWVSASVTALTEQGNTPHAAALTYVKQLPRTSRIVVDNTYWNDVVRAGWTPEKFNGAIWFYKIDQDSASKVAIKGYQDLDYMIWSPTIAKDPNQQPIVRAAFEHSKLLAAYGKDETRVEIRAVIK